MAETAPLPPAIDALVREPPSRDAWARLCRLLDDVSPAALEAAASALERALAAWPPDLRKAPVRWSRELLGGAASPKHRLARGLEGPVDLLAALTDDEWTAGGRRVERAFGVFDARRRAAIFAANLGRRLYTAPVLLSQERAELVEFDLETGAEQTLEADAAHLELLWCHPRQSLALVAYEGSDGTVSLCLYDRQGPSWQAPVTPAEARSLRHTFDATTDRLYAYAPPARRLWQGVAPELTELALPTLEGREWQSFVATGGALLGGDTAGWVHLLDPRSLEPISSLRVGGYPIDDLFGSGDFVVALERGDHEEFGFTAEGLRICSLSLIDLSAPDRPTLARTFELFAPLRRPPPETDGPSLVVRHAAEGSNLAWHACAVTPAGGLRVALATDKHDLWTVDFPAGIVRHRSGAPPFIDPVALVAGADALLGELMNLLWLEG